MTPVDVAIVGGGPAGLSAATVLGRARKTVVVVDGGTARNASAPEIHGLLGHDGIAPAELRRIAWHDLARYPSVTRLDAIAVALERDGARLAVSLSSGASPLLARRVLLAPGVVDSLPKIPGLREAWGRSAFSCPYCHGWELRDRRWGVLALQKSIVKLLPLLATWTDDVLLFLHGRTDIDPSALAGRRVEPRVIGSIIADDGAIRAVELEDGERIDCGALLLHPGGRQTDLVLFAGLTLDDEGLIRIDDDHQTSMRGVHACGDCASGARPHAIFAAADGTRAAMSLVELLLTPASPRR
jgi:thioredoxin reductase